MKMKVLTRLGALVTAVAMCTGVSMSANAALTLASNGVGYIVPTVIPPSGLDISYLQNMINTYNSGGPSATIGSETYTVFAGSATPPAPLPNATSLGSDITPSVADGYGQSTATIHLGAGGYSYLIAQWDGPNGADAVYYISGQVGDVTLVNDLPNGMAQYGLSGYWLGHSTSDTPVPEPTTILAGALLLLPLGASTFRMLRKRV